MSHGNDQLAVAVQEALKEGEIAAPDALVALVGTFENPVQALLNMDSANQLFDALDSEFGFIRVSFIENRRTPAAEILPADRLRYAALIRWLIRELRSWRGADDPRQAKLVSAFVVAQRCDSGNGLWSCLPDEIGESIDLLHHLERLLGTFAVSFDAMPGTEVPIWEGEAVEEFKRADAERDWPVVLGRWQNFQRQAIFFFANVLQIQTVRLLYRYNGAYLINGISNLHQTPVLVVCTENLNPHIMVMKSAKDRV